MTGQIKDQIRYEDDAVLVCRKPAGIPVQTARAGQQDMVSLLKNYRAAKKRSRISVWCTGLTSPWRGSWYSRNQTGGGSACRTGWRAQCG